MSKTLKEQVLEYNSEIKSALSGILRELNPGQRQKLLRNEAVKRLLRRYHMEGEEERE